MLKIILIGLAINIFGFLIAAAFQPADYQISRSTLVAAPPAVVFANVNDLNRYLLWSPFVKMDPEAKTTIDSPPAGPGASLSWVGPKTGEGRMTLIESEPNKLVRFRMDFLKPMASSATAELTFVPEGDQTRVTWSLAGRNGYLQKVFSMVMNMDKMLGGIFEQGLADLASLSAKPALEARLAGRAE